MEENTHATGHRLAFKFNGKEADEGNHDETMHAIVTVKKNKNLSWM